MDKDPVMGLFRPGVPLPPGGFRTTSEKKRIATVLLSIRRRASHGSKSRIPMLPVELIVAILQMAKMFLPKTGIDPVKFIRWFTARTVAPVPVEMWDGVFRIPPFHGRHRLKDILKGGEMDHATSIDDLKRIWIENVSGSSMVWRELPAPTWHPNDIDLFMTCQQAIALLEEWLKLAFKDVRVVQPDAEVLRRRRETNATPSKTAKWTVGMGITFNAIVGPGDVVNHFDFEPASTHIRHPFDKVYRTFDPVNGPFIIHRAIMYDYPEVHEEQVPTMRFVVDRNAKRIEMYRKRFPNLTVQDGPESADKQFWYNDADRGDAMVGVWARGRHDNPLLAQLDA